MDTQLADPNWVGGSSTLAECIGIQWTKVALRLEKVFKCFLLFLLRNDYEIRFALANVSHYLEELFVLVLLLV